MRLSWPTRPSVGRRPHVEVVVPCYNYGHFLPGCVDSIVEQPDVTVSVTVVDDASTDDSASVAERLADQHSAVRLIRNESNIGAVPTFNRGLAQADSDYVVLISADDLLAPGALARATGLMDAHPRVGMVYGHAQKFATTPTPHRAMPTATWTTWQGDAWARMQLRRSWNNISSPEAVVRTSVQHQVGLYDPGLPNTHDLEMWLRISAVADVGHVNGVDQAYYRRHPVSLSMQLESYGEVWERWRAYDLFLSRSWGRDDEEALRGHVRRRLSDEILADLLSTLDSAPVPDDRIEKALDIAYKIDPDVTERAAWADIERIRRRERPTASARARAVRRRLLERGHWRRWRRFRYLG